MNLVQFRIIWFVIVIGGMQTVVAQTETATSLLAEFQKAYLVKKEYNLDMSYTMYRGYEGEKITQQYKGTLYKKGSFFRMEAMQMEVVQCTDGQVRIDHKNKLIYYSRSQGKIDNPADISQILQFYIPVSVEKKGQSNSIVLELKNRELPLPFQRVILHIDEKTNTLQQQELFFGQKIPFTNTSGIQEYDLARVIIKLSDRKTDENEPIKSFSDYIITRGASIIASDTYKQYTLIDQTNL